jgi:hypothetical protein
LQIQKKPQRNTYRGFFPLSTWPGAGLTQATEILPPRRTPTRGGAPLWIATIVKHCNALAHTRIKRNSCRGGDKIPAIPLG